MIERFLERNIKKRLGDSKAIVITGPRQTGKSTLLQQCQPTFKQPVAWWNGDDDCFAVAQSFFNIPF